MDLVGYNREVAREDRLMTSALVPYTKDGIEIYISNEGESFASIRSYARMANKSPSTISERFQGVRKKPLKTAEILTPGGTQGVRLLDEDTIAEWLPNDNPALATKIMKLGIRKFLHTLAGYEHQPQPALPQTYVQALEALLASEKQKEQLLLQAAKDAPKVKLAEDFIDRESLVMIGDFAKDNGTIGRNTLFALLRDKGVLTRDNKPMQRYVDEGLFVLKPNGHVNNYGREGFTTHLTAAGVEWLNRRLPQWITE